MILECEKPHDVAREMIWLAWKASRVVGMGIYQDNPHATKEQVLKSCGADSNRSSYYCDYISGRMMKFSLRVTVNGVDVSDDPLRPDYQSWCGSFKNYAELAQAAMEKIGTPSLAGA